MLAESGSGGGGGGSVNVVPRRPRGNEDRGRPVGDEENVLARLSVTVPIP